MAERLDELLCLLMGPPPEKTGHLRNALSVLVEVRVLGNTQYTETGQLISCVIKVFLQLWVPQFSSQREKLRQDKYLQESQL